MNLYHNMIIINNLATDLSRLPPRHLVMAVGNFDGLHLGHQAVIGRAVDIARQQEFASAVLTFRQHPRAILNPHNPPILLLPPGEKVRRIEQMGVKVLINLDFTSKLANLSPDQFIRQVLYEDLNLSQIVIGEDFRFGKNRQGTPELLRQEGIKLGFQVTIIPPVRIGEEEVSSTHIRNLLHEGKVRQASICLNRDYEISCKVIPGDKRGRELGFPTANLQVLNELIPKEGVYAVWAVLDGKRYPGMLNIGNRPTFPNSEPAIEVHLIDYEGDLYGKVLNIHFVDWIRDEKTFPDIESLQKQLIQDQKKISDALGKIDVHSSSSIPLSE